MDSPEWKSEQGFRIDAGDILSADGDPSAADIPEPGGKAGNGGLSAARRADKRCVLVLLCREGHILQDRFVLTISMD